MSTPGLKKISATQRRPLPAHETSRLHHKCRKFILAIQVVTIPCRSLSVHQWMTRNFQGGRDSEGPEVVFPRSTEVFLISRRSVTVRPWSTESGSVIFQKQGKQADQKSLLAFLGREVGKLKTLINQENRQEPANPRPRSPLSPPASLSRGSVSSLKGGDQGQGQSAAWWAQNFHSYCLSCFLIYFCQLCLKFQFFRILIHTT